MWLLIGIVVVVVVLALKLFAKLPEKIESDSSFADQATTLLDQGKVEGAIALAERRLSKFPADGEAYWYLGKACYRVGDPERALICMLKVQELQPEWDASLAANLIKAIKEKQSGVSAAPSSGDVPFAERVVMLMDQGKSEEAIALAEERISKFPADSLAHWYLGRASYDVGELERALACMNKVRELQPSWDESHTVPFIKAIERKQAGIPAKSGSGGMSFPDHAKMLLDQGKGGELIALAEERISDYPGDGQAHWWLGKACYQAGDLERALGCMLKVQDLQPDWDLSHTAPFIEAIKKKLVGNSSESGLSDISFPDHAKMLLDQGKEDEVIALAEGRISKYPGDGQAHWWLGKACYHAGDLIASVKVV